MSVTAHHVVTREQLIAEIARLRDVLGQAEAKVAAQDAREVAQSALIDKLTAAHLRMQLLFRKLNEARR